MAAKWKERWGLTVSRTMSLQTPAGYLHPVDPRRFHTFSAENPADAETEPRATSPESMSTLRSLWDSSLSSLSAAAMWAPVLAKVAHDAGWRIVVVDDRPDFANAERFPDADEIFCGDYGDALSRYPINSATYVIAVTRGHKHDEIALKAVINSPACYIGMIGSKRRVATVLRHLEEEGVAKDKLDRVWTPIGLDIGAETPEEIAVSIAAEMIMVRRGGNGGSMALKERHKAG